MLCRVSTLTAAIRQGIVFGGQQMFPAADSLCMKMETLGLDFGVESEDAEWIDNASIKGGQEHSSTVTQGLDQPQAAAVRGG